MCAGPGVVAADLVWSSPTLFFAVGSTPRSPSGCRRPGSGRRPGPGVRRTGSRPTRGGSRPASSGCDPGVDHRQGPTLRRSSPAQPRPRPIGNAAGRRRCPTRSISPPRLPWPRTCSAAPSMPEFGGLRSGGRGLRAGLQVPLLVRAAPDRLRRRGSRNQSIPLSLDADISQIGGSRRADDLVARAPEQAWKRR